MERTINLTVPASWTELSQQQLRFLLRAMVRVQNANKNVPFASMDDAAVQTSAQVSTICFLHWAGLELICPCAGGWLVLHGQDEFILTMEQIAAAVTHLDWIKSLPGQPVRLDRVDGAQARVADLSSDFSFDSWLSCEAIWQAYLATSDDMYLRQMAAILYDKDDIKPDAAELLGVFYWWAAVKNLMAAMFPNFFQPSAAAGAASPTSEDMRRGMDAQIRALTKGDITKESSILAMEAVRAITELDALAREYEELNRKYGKPQTR